MLLDLIFFLSLIVIGLLIGFPLGQISGHRKERRFLTQYYSFTSKTPERSEPAPVHASRQRLNSKNILNAEVIE